MNTGYYAVHGRLENTVAISAKVPDFYKGRCYKKLAPSWSIYSEWKASGDNDLYIKRFNSEILTPLSPEEVYENLGDDAILLCYESAEKFCHRHLVAEWLMKNLGVEIKELPRR